MKGLALHFSSVIVFVILFFGCSHAPESSGGSRNDGVRRDLSMTTHPIPFGKASLATNNAPPPERVMVDITTNCMQTCIGFWGTRPPPPWPRGNWLMFDFRR